MTPLITTPNVARPDDLFQLLVDAHTGFSPDASARLDARLVLLLANHIGDERVLVEAIAAARAGVSEPHS